MTKLTTFAHQDRGIIINVDTTAIGIEMKLINWLEKTHNDIYWDVELHEGGSVIVQDREIMFIGDNGIFILDAIPTIKTIK